jgi:hypothetical protein
LNDLPHHERHPIAQIASDDEQANRVTRRTILTGAAAATAAATLAVVDTPASARSLDPNSHEDMVAFVVLSAALTGIAESKLAPGFSLQTQEPGSDPVNIKREYFVWVNTRHPVVFARLLQIARDNFNVPSGREQAIIGKLPTGDDTELTQSEIDIRYLARSIVLMWYLGAWYDPDNLQTSNASNFEVISPKAYTQGWALKVAQAHPMGFSEMQFGYWTRPPNPRDQFTG